MIIENSEEKYKMTECVRIDWRRNRGVLFIPDCNIVDNCPKCGNQSVYEIEDRGIINPLVNDKNEVWMLCYDCDERWMVAVKISVTLEEWD